MISTLQDLSESIPTYMTVAALAIVAMEWIALTIVHKVEDHREGWTNIASGAVSFLPVFVLSMVLTTSLMFRFYEMRLFDLGLDWWVWVLAYLAYDLMAFLIHLASHKVRFFWIMHSAHHSPTEMKASVSFRGSFADFLITPHTSLWLPLLGFHPFLVIIVEGLGMIYGVPLHLSEKYMPASEPSWLRRVFMTPSIHRLHHAKNPVYLDTNYGLTFSVWDHLFRTYQNIVHGEKVAYGLTNDLDGSNFVLTQTDELKSLRRDMKSAPRLADKLKYLYMPPGWNHRDGGHTVRQMRRKEE